LLETEYATPGEGTARTRRRMSYGGFFAPISGVQPEIHYKKF